VTVIQALDILKQANKPAEFAGMALLWHKDQHIPGSTQYNIKRYYAQDTWSTEDTGMFVYHYNPDQPRDNFLELRFCISGNRFCENKECGNCNQLPTEDCAGPLRTVDVFSFHFTSTFLHQFLHNVKLTTTKDEVLAFKHPNAFTKIFPLSLRKRNTLDSVLNHSYTGSLENIFINAKIHELLLQSLDVIVDDEKEEGFTCKFLADDRGKESIYQAREILLQHIGDPITIKELSRKVAMNECYLKKGFKEVFGTTIFDFYQQQRMEHAKYLLYEKALSVTDVSALLGYSSISHFSAAFKKHTGLKPCELLN
jgi:AraC family transcriptional regulator